MNLQKWKLFRQLEPSLTSACKFAKILRFPEASVGFLVLHDDDVYAVTDKAENFTCLGNGINYAGAVVYQACKVESLCGKGIVDFYGNEFSFEALTEDGCVYSWVSAHSKIDHVCRTRALTNPDGVPRKVLFPDASSIQVCQVSCGTLHTLCLSLDGEVFGWNDNTYGQLGSESAGSFASNAVKVTGFNDSIVQVASGSFTSYALDSLGKVWSWGSCSQSSLGYEASDDQPIPRLIENLPKITKIAVAAFHTLALSEIGEVYFWGQFEFVNVDTPDHQVIPLWPVVPIKISIEGMEPVIDIASSLYSSYAVFQSKNTVYLYGTWNDQCYLMPIATEFSSMEEVFASAKPPIMLRPILVKTKPQRVLDAWKRAFNDPSTADVLFSVNGEVLHAHSVFLKFRSDYFQSMFDNEWEESRRESGTIEIHGFNFRTFKAFIYFLYSEHFIEPDMTVDDLTELMRAADYYGDGDLRLACENKLKTKLTPENACFVYACAARSNAEDLQNYAVEFMVPVYKQVVNSDECAKMDSDLKTKLMIHFADLDVIRVPMKRRTL